MEFDVFERRVCAVADQPLATQRNTPCDVRDDDALLKAIEKLVEYVPHNGAATSQVCFVETVPSPDERGPNTHSYFSLLLIKRLNVMGK